MEYRRLGKTSFDVSAVGFGAWGIGSEWGPVDDDTSIDALHAAVDAGVTLSTPPTSTAASRFSAGFSASARSGSSSLPSSGG